MENRNKQKLTLNLDLLRVETFDPNRSFHATRGTIIAHAGPLPPPPPPTIYEPACYAPPTVNSCPTACYSCATLCTCPPATYESCVTVQFAC